MGKAMREGYGVRRSRPIPCLASGILAAAFALPARTAASAPDPDRLRILHYTYTGPGASRHAQAMEAAEKALRDLAAERDWESVRVEDPAFFTDANLAPFHVLFFDNVCCASIFTSDDQRRAVERFLRSGRGYVGSHAATASEPGWAFWRGLHGGAINNGHPAPDTGTARVETFGHPATRGLPARWSLGLNEWFHYDRDPRANPKVKVLVSLPAGSVVAGHRFAEDLAVSWCTFHEGARAFYSSLGHFPTAFTDPRQREHFLAALDWAGGRGPQNGLCGEPVTTDLSRTGARPFASAVFRHETLPGGVRVRALADGACRMALRDARGALIATAAGGRGIHDLSAPGPGLYRLEVRAGGHSYHRAVVVLRRGGRAGGFP